MKTSQTKMEIQHIEPYNDQKSWDDMTKQEQAANVQAHYDKASKANKAQHSPLPRLTEAEAKENMTGAYITLADGRTQYCEHLSERERRAVNHADKLAEALREIKRETNESRDFRSAVMCADIAHKALKAYEAAQ